MLNKSLHIAGIIFGMFTPTYAIFIFLSWFVPSTFWQKFILYIFPVAPLIIIQLIFFALTVDIISNIFKDPRPESVETKISFSGDWNQALKELVKEYKDKEF